MISTIVTEIAVMVMDSVLLPKGCFTKMNIVVLLKSTGAGIIAGTALVFIERELQMWYLSAVIGLALYGLLLSGLKVITKREWTMLTNYLFLRSVHDNTTRFTGESFHQKDLTTLVVSGENSIIPEKTEY